MDSKRRKKTRSRRACLWLSAGAFISRALREGRAAGRGQLLPYASNPAWGHASAPAAIAAGQHRTAAGGRPRLLRVWPGSGLLCACRRPPLHHRVGLPYLKNFQRGFFSARELTGGFRSDDAPDFSAAPGLLSFLVRVITAAGTLGFPMSSGQTFKPPLVLHFAGVCKDNTYRFPVVKRQTLNRPLSCRRCALGLGSVAPGGINQSWQPSPESPNFLPPIWGEENFGYGIHRKRRKRRTSVIQFSHSQLSFRPITPRETSPVMASLVRVALRSVWHVRRPAPAFTAASSSIQRTSGGAPGLPVAPSLNIGCRRRLNIEPPCRFNIEPGRVANS